MCNHCGSGNAISITHSEGLFIIILYYIILYYIILYYIILYYIILYYIILLFFTYPACNARAPYLWPPRLYIIYSHYLINSRFFEKKILNIKRAFRFSL